MSLPPLDDEVLPEVWEGKVPLEFQLAPEEQSTLEPPASFYLALPRYTYLPLSATPSLRRHFESSVPALVAREEVWFSCTAQGEPVPLKWHLPLGVLYDQYGQGAVPWVVRVNFQRFPSEQLLRCPDEETIKAYFLHALKQANYLRTGDAKTFNELSIAETTDLWAAVLRGEAGRWRRVHLHLLNSSGRASRPWAALPLRLLRPGRAVLQEPLPPITPEGGDLTLRAALERLVPDSFKSGPPEVVVAGIRPSLETPLQWLATHLCAPDHWLYVTLL